MNEGLSGIKNIIWSMGIVLSLLALLVGLVFSISNRFYGQREDPTLDLNDPKALTGDKVPITAGSDSAALKELPGTQDAGLEYFFNLTFICDGTVLGINDYSTGFGGTATAQLWSDDGSGFPASAASDVKIFYPADGSMLTVAEAAKLSQPKRVVIFIGGDGLSAATEESFVSGYTALIRGIQSSSPATSTVICCSLSSVTPAYAGIESLSPSLIAQANEWIRQVCIDTGVYFADLASVLNDGDGYLTAEYALMDGKTLNTTGVSKLIEYFRMHAA